MDSQRLFQECIEYVRRVWTDIRPRSVQQFTCKCDLLAGKLDRRDHSHVRSISVRVESWRKQAPHSCLLPAEETLEEVQHAWAWLRADHSASVSRRFHTSQSKTEKKDSAPDLRVIRQRIERHLAARSILIEHRGTQPHERTETTVKVDEDSVRWTTPQGDDGPASATTCTQLQFSGFISIDGQALRVSVRLPLPGLEGTARAEVM